MKNRLQSAVSLTEYLSRHDTPTSHLDWRACLIQVVAPHDEETQ